MSVHEPKDDATDLVHWWASQLSQNREEQERARRDLDRLEGEAIEIRTRLSAALRDERARLDKIGEMLNEGEKL